YFSRRISNQDPFFLSLGKRTKVEGLPDPGKPYLSELGGGVSCLVSLALYTDSGGTLPHAAVDAAKPAASRKPDGFLPSGNDRATRLATIAQAWNVFQHFYPYFDVVKTDWPSALRQALTAAAKDADERAFLITLRRLVAECRTA